MGAPLKCAVSNIEHNSYKINICFTSIMYHSHNRIQLTFTIFPLSFTLYSTTVFVLPSMVSLIFGRLSMMTDVLLTQSTDYHYLL